MIYFNSPDKWVGIMFCKEENILVLQLTILLKLQNQNKKAILKE